MLKLCLLAGWLAAAPQLDADASLAGATVAADTLASLPHGRGVVDALDVTLLAPVSGGIGGGGIDLFDPVWLSVHGYSWTQLHHAWGEVNVDDPAAAGQPLLQLPLEATAGLRLSDAWGRGPTLTLHTPTLAEAGRRPVTQVKLHGAYAHVLDGGVWLPRNLLDREPAFAYGAPRRRRALSRASEARASSAVPVADGTLVLLAEQLEHGHRYLQLPGVDRAQRRSAALAFGRSVRGWPLQLRLAYQADAQAAAGAFARWPVAELHARASQAWLLQLEGTRRLRGGARASVALGLGLRGVQDTPRQAGPAARDLLDQWLTLSRPTLPQTRRSFVSTARVRWIWPLGDDAAAAPARPEAPRLAPGLRPTTPAPAARYTATSAGAPAALTAWAPADEAPALCQLPTGGEVALLLPPIGRATAPAPARGGLLALQLDARLAGVRRRPAADVGPLGLTSAGTPLQQLQLDGARAEAGTLVAELQLQLAYRRVLRPAPPGAPWRPPVVLDAEAGWQAARVATAHHALGRLAPDVGVALRGPLGPFAAFALLRRTPEAVTSQLTDALGGDAGVGQRYAWQDANGDGLPQPDEAGAALGPFGGATRQVAAHLRVPSHHLLQLGLQLPLPGGWSAGLRGNLHLLRHRYALRAASTSAAVPGATSARTLAAATAPPVPSTTTSSAPLARLIERRTFVDPGGDGRGEHRGADGHQHLAVRASWPTTARTSEPLALENARRLAGYYGVELELHSPPGAAFFVDVLGAAYLSAGEAPFGNGADRNDPGVLAADAVGPNADVHAYGRYDHDRSFALKLQAGVRPLDGLSLAVAGRYRDGQPFARLVVVPDLPQGPEVVMATGRGGARYTFRMNWDVRLRYSTAALRPFGLTVTADVYNVLGSATEIDEDPRTGPGFRTALEAIPGRSAWVGLELAFLP